MIVFLVSGLALPGCQEMGDVPAPASSAPPVAEATADPGYPLLQSVPPRPQLSYTVQQQRQIVEALIADRENARYTSQAVRHRSGLSSLPPPPTPPEPATSTTIEPAIAARAGTGPQPRLVEQETLIDFLGALLFDDAPDQPGSDRSSGSEVHDEPAADATRQEPPAPAAGSTASPGDRAGQVPAPPARGAVAARIAAGSDAIDTLIDETVPQAPLPPGQSALAARLAVAGQVVVGAPAAPLPAARPALARSAEAALPASPPSPPPLKPIVPVDAPMPPRPVEKPADHRSAAVRGSWETASARPSVRTGPIVAHAAP